MGQNNINKALAWLREFENTVQAERALPPIAQFMQMAFLPFRFECVMPIYRRLPIAGNGILISRK